MSFEDWMIEDGFTDPEEYLQHLQAEAFKESDRSNYVPEEDFAAYDEMFWDDIESAIRALEEEDYDDSGFNETDRKKTGDVKRHEDGTEENEQEHDGETSKRKSKLFMNTQKVKQDSLLSEIYESLLSGGFGTNDPDTKKNHMPEIIEKALDEIKAKEGFDRLKLIDEAETNTGPHLLNFLIKTYTEKNVRRINFDPDSLTILPFGPENNLYMVADNCTAFLGKLVRIHSTKDYKISLFEGYGLKTILLENLKDSKDKHLIRVLEK